MSTSYPSPPYSNQGGVLKSKETCVPSQEHSGMGTHSPAGATRHRAASSLRRCKSIHSMCPNRGRVGPLLRKPGNTLFSGLNAQIPSAVTGHTSCEPNQSHSVDWKFLWVVLKLQGRTQSHPEFQTQSWERDPGDPGKAKAHILPLRCG